MVTSMVFAIGETFVAKRRTMAKWSHGAEENPSLVGFLCF
ncbi:MAG: hypothetical protein UV64_C0019G0003 [Parcubacteria group bacterium GW2011_GWC1_43_11b]|nr:MAG: hypothetical protein UV64_C0019G0003 [Parcubacteria group bacterium GW2011_GWC1_43_11b]